MLKAHPRARLWVHAIWVNKLFGPDATLTSQPAPLVSSGSPVDHRIGNLRRALDPLLATSWVIRIRERGDPATGSAYSGSGARGVTR